MSALAATAGADPGQRAPSLWRRMASFVYEGLLLFGIGLIPGALGALFLALTGQHHPLQSDSALRAYTLLLYAVYFTWFWSRRGQTLPMQTWNIQVVTRDGQPLSQWRALVRFIASCLWFAPAALLCLLNGWCRWQALLAAGVGVCAFAALTWLHPQRQFWHDALCGTRLLSVQRTGKASVQPGER